MNLGKLSFRQQNYIEYKYAISRLCVNLHVKNKDKLYLKQI